MNETDKLIFKNLEYLVIKVRKQSKAWFCLYMGWSRGYFSKQIRAERPNHISAVDLYKAAQMFHVSMEDLMTIDLEEKGIVI